MTPTPSPIDREAFPRRATASDNRSMPPVDPEPPMNAEGPAEPLLDVSLLTDYAGFVVRALRRHTRAAILIPVVTTALAAALAMTWPRTYQVDGRLLVQRSSLVSSLVNPERSLVRDAASPTIGAQEVVHSRANLLAIMHETDLIAEWTRRRPWLLRVKDRTMELLGPAPSEEQRVDAMVGLLENRLQVGTGDEGTISFVLTWPDAVMAQKIVDLAMQRYLEQRRVTELSAITDSIEILDKSANQVEAQIASTISQMPRPTGGGRVRRPAPVRPAPVAGPSAESTVRLARLRSALEARQQDVARLDGARTQQLAEAQARLSAALTIYTDGHPTVVALRQTMARLSTEPPELVAARQEAGRLEDEYDALSTAVGAAAASAEQERLVAQIEASTPFDIGSVVRPADSGTDALALRLKDQMTELAAVRARASSARAELASVQAGFKYQYAVVRPPQVPRAPLSPNVIAIVLAGFVASLGLAVAFAVGHDLAGGRVLEAWQVERRLLSPIAVRVPRL